MLTFQTTDTSVIVFGATDGGGGREWGVGEGSGGCSRLLSPLISASLTLPSQDCALSFSHCYTA